MSVLVIYHYTAGGYNLPAVIAQPRSALTATIQKLQCSTTFRALIYNSKATEELSARLLNVQDKSWDINGLHLGAIALASLLVHCDAFKEKQLCVLCAK